MEDWKVKAHQDYINFMAQEGYAIEPEKPYVEKDHYYIYVLSQDVPLFMANHFQPIEHNQYQPIQGYTLMRLTLSFQTSKSAFIKRIYRFYPHTSFIIPPQRLNNKIWNRSNKH